MQGQPGTKTYPWKWAVPMMLVRNGKQTVSIQMYSYFVQDIVSEDNKDIEVHVPVVDKTQANEVSNVALVFLRIYM